MINTVESLRGLYVALGGNISEVANLTTIPELLTEISTVAQAAATELPAVKPADNGKVLTVVNSKWAKADLPTAASDKLGGIKVGSGLAIADGVLSASGGLPAVTADDKNKVLAVNNSGNWAKSNNIPRYYAIPNITGLLNVSGTTVTYTDSGTLTPTTAKAAYAAGQDVKLYLSVVMGDVSLTGVTLNMVAWTGLANGSPFDATSKVIFGGTVNSSTDWYDIYIMLDSSQTSFGTGAIAYVKKLTE